MYVCMCVCMYACMYVYTYICAARRNPFHWFGSPKDLGFVESGARSPTNSMQQRQLLESSACIESSSQDEAAARNRTTMCDRLSMLDSQDLLPGPSSPRWLHMPPHAFEDVEPLEPCTAIGKADSKSKGSAAKPIPLYSHIQPESLGPPRAFGIHVRALE